MTIVASPPTGGAGARLFGALILHPVLAYARLWRGYGFVHFKVQAYVPL